ncbi:MAG TPA: hypothetical protein DDX39_02465 [Bacteroidales bacterium]|nr:MAG: hypothetical protein A2W98_03480 [Bacteroidetes bacterium GWF2_33_38]OFY67929.1 MAG: hypothetical protein A2265_03525 [Bacteroidetes bacterium RIFOXYA12_FULL_33_9]OFY85281.1 MAG: hypothetical protein A2236_11340 [Bacteroidetes bacterium RIFOXYA2_FULL_33_7]HBF87479.1 hypothetical protein [Bacteroidales bacterium]
MQEDSYFTSILVDSNKTYSTFFSPWGDDCGMLLVNDDTSIFYNYLNTPELNLPYFTNNALFCLIKDNQDNIWMGGSDGMLKFNNDEWTLYNSDNSVIPVYAWCRDIRIDANEKIVAAFDHQISIFNNGAWENINIDAINPYDIEIYSFIIDKNNNFIIGTRDNGIFIYNGIDWQNFNIDNSELPGNEIRCLEIDSSNNIWAGTDSGLVKYNYSEWSIYNVDNSFVPLTNIIYDIQIDKNNNIWFVNKAGITVFNEDWVNWIDYKEKEKNEIIIYPNPVKDYVKLKYKEKIKSVEIYSIMGVLELKERYKGEINVMNLNSGVYFLKINTQSNTSITAKMVKE